MRMDILVCFCVLLTIKTKCAHNRGRFKNHQRGRCRAFSPPFYLLCCDKFKIHFIVCKSYFFIFISPWISCFLKLFSQAVNFWQVLVMNDEHTERRYLLYFLLGWGLPALVIIVLVIVLLGGFGWKIHEVYGLVQGDVWVSNTCKYTHKWSFWTDGMYPVNRKYT